VKYSIYIKSGTCGWFSYDGCDQWVKEVEGAATLPRVGEYIELVEHDEKHITKFLVTEVKHYISEHGSFISVYVIRV